MNPGGQSCIGMQMGQIRVVGFLSCQCPYFTDLLLDFINFHFLCSLCHSVCSQGKQLQILPQSSDCVSKVLEWLRLRRCACSFGAYVSHTCSSNRRRGHKFLFQFFPNIIGQVGWIHSVRVSSSPDPADQSLIATTKRYHDKSSPGTLLSTDCSAHLISQPASHPSHSQNHSP